MRTVLKRARDVIVVEGTEGRNPFEVFLLAWVAFAGTAALVVGPPASESPIPLLPYWLVMTWYTLLCIGGSVGLAGVWIRNLILSMLVERAAMLILSPSALLFAVVLFSLGGAPALFSSSLTLAFAVMTFVRFVRINAQLRKLRSLMGVVAKS